MSQHTNKVRIKAVANALKPVAGKFVFAGGAVVALYPDRTVFEVRPTDDVDVIVEILSYSERIALEENLRAAGFVNDIESGIVCRYIVKGVTVDIMPTDDPSVGFSNYWYPEGFRNAVDHRIDEHHTVKILDTPYFIATKLEAFKSRGNRNGRTSHDFEDIVFVLENRSTVWQELALLNGAIRDYLVAEFKWLVNNPAIYEWIDCHVERNPNPATGSIIEAMKQFSRSF